MRRSVALQIALTCATAALCASSFAAESLTLRFREAASLQPSGTTVRFVGYVDQRCPRELQCLVPGVAHVWLWVSAGSAEAKLLSVSWPHKFALAGQTNEAFGYQFCFANLEPRPSQVGAVSPLSLTLRLSIERVGPPATACKDGV